MQAVVSILILVGDLMFINDHINLVLKSAFDWEK